MERYIAGCIFMHFSFFIDVYVGMGTNKSVSMGTAQHIKKKTKELKNENKTSLFIYAMCADYYLAMDDIANSIVVLKKGNDKINEILSENNNDINQLKPGIQRAILTNQGFYNFICLGNLMKAYEMFENITLKWPYDLYAAKRGQLIAFIMGETNLMLKIVKNIEKFHIFNQLLAINNNNQSEFNYKNQQNIHRNHKNSAYIHGGNL